MIETLTMIKIITNTCCVTLIGDRIVSVTINMEHMVLEDALTILSYASSYPIKLLLMRERRRQHLSTNDDARADEDGNEEEEEAEEAAFSISRFQHLFRSQSVEGLSTIQSRNASFHLRDDFPPFIGDGRWSADVECRRKKTRSALTDDHFRSTTSRSDDDWARWKNQSQMTLRFSGCSLIAHAGSLGNTSSRGSTLNSIAADVRHRRINCLDLSRIPEAAAAAADSCLFMKSRTASRLGLMSVGLGRHGPEKFSSVQAIVGQGDRKKGSNCDSLPLSTGSPLKFLDGRSVSDGDLLHDTRNRWPQFSLVRQKNVPSSNAGEDLNTNPSAFSTQQTSHPNPVLSAAAAAQSTPNDAFSCEEGATPENAGENGSERVEQPDSEILFDAPKSNSVPAESESDEINRDQKQPQPQLLDQNANVECHYLRL